MTMSVNARLRQLQRIVDCDPRIVKLRDDTDAITRVILDFQKRQADAYFVIDQLRGMLSEHAREIETVTASIRGRR